MAKQTPDVVNRGERILAYVMLVMVGLSIIAFFAVIIGSSVGAADLATGLWPVIYLIMYLALPIAVLMLVSLMIVSARRRSREAAAEDHIATARSRRTSRGK